MARIKVTDEDIRTLEAKANLAYKTLHTGVKTSPTLISSAECLYRHDLGGYLANLTEKPTASIASLRKGGKRASQIEGFIMQCLLMHKFPSEYDNGSYNAQIPENEDGMGGLKAYIDAEEPDPQKAEIFKRIQNKAAELRENKRHDQILKAMCYVREELYAGKDNFIQNKTKH